MWRAEAYEEDAVVGRALGRPWLLLNAPASIQRVLVDNPAGYRRTPASIRILWPITGRGLLLAEGAEWRWQRRTTAPALAPRTLPLLLPHMARAAAAALPGLRAAAAAGPVDLLAAMQTLALDVAARAMLSLAAGGFAARCVPSWPLRRAHGAADAARPGVAAGPADAARPGALAVPAALDAADGRDRRARGRRRRRRRDRATSTTCCAPPAIRKAARGFRRAQLRDQIATLIVAGHETTALALFWSLYLLANTPAAQERVAAEVEGVDLGADGAAAALPRLAFTAAVVNEALRLFPPAFTLVRQARAADRAGAVAIPRGAVVMIAPWVLHRHRRLWAEPDAFLPERFLPGARRRRASPICRSAPGRGCASARSSRSPRRRCYWRRWCRRSASRWRARGRCCRRRSSPRSPTTRRGSGCASGANGPLIGC